MEGKKDRKENAVRKGEIKEWEGKCDRMQGEEREREGETKKG